MSDKRIIEINGVKLEVDLRTATRVEELKIGDRVKVMKKEYGDEIKVYPGVIVGFEPFASLPTIVVAFVKDNYSSAAIEFLYFNQKSSAEIVHANDADFSIDRDVILGRFEREITKKEAELQSIRDQRQYFLDSFGVYFSQVVAPKGA